MCKKRRNQNDVLKKPINEMTDTEFITNADYLASPYYRAYVTARARAVTQPSKKGQSRTVNYGYTNGGYYNNGNYNRPAPAPVYSSATNAKRSAPAEEDGMDYAIFNEGAPAPSNKAQYQAGRPQAAPYCDVASDKLPRNRREKKRWPFLLLIAIFTLIIIVMAVAYFIDVPAFSAYTSIYTLNGDSPDFETQITLTDTIVGMIKCLNIDLPLESEFYTRYLVGNVEDNIVMTAISLYSVPIAALLVVFFALIGFIKALVAICAKRKSDGFYKKIGFGFLSIATFICGAIMVVGGLYAARMEFSNFPAYLTFACPFIHVNYGLYGILGITVLNFIFSCLAYKKGKAKRVAK